MSQNASINAMTILHTHAPVRVAVAVERTHVVDLLEVDVGEDELVIGRVDDGGPVAARKHVTRRRRLERAQRRRLRAERHLLAVRQRTCTGALNKRVSVVYEYV